MKFFITTASLLSILVISACMQDRPVIEKTELDVVTPPATVIHSFQTAAQRQPQADMRVESEQLRNLSRLPLIKLKEEKKSRLDSPSIFAFSNDVMGQQWHSSMNRDQYGELTENNVKRVVEEPVSTFSIDVDTGSYAVVRRHLNQGVLPPGDAVRTEELINYFDYFYPQPDLDGAPFSVSTEMITTPCSKHTQLLRIGLQGCLPADKARSPANLVFLIDVSGSMNAPDKLPLLKNAFRLLVNQLSKQDKITMIVYAGSSGVVLEPTEGHKKGDILAALDKLSGGGSTHGSAGIQLAYNMAEHSFIKGGINRVILATDGDCNIGTVNHDALLDIIERKKNKEFH